MKEKLLERLQLMNKAIEEKHQALQQANADLNMLNGCRQELQHVIHMLDLADAETRERGEHTQEKCVVDNCPEQDHLAVAQVA